MALQGFFALFTPLATFFIVFGYMMIRGDQIHRFERWWTREKGKGEEEVVFNGESLNNEMRKVGLKVMYSFSKGNLKGFLRSIFLKGIFFN